MLKYDHQKFYLIICLSILVLAGCKKSNVSDTAFSPLPNDENVNSQRQENFLDERIAETSLKPEFYFYRAKSNYEQDKLEDALKDIQIAVRLDSSQSRYFFWKGMILADLSTTETALQAAKKAEKMGFESIGLDILIAKLYYQINEPNLALRYLRKARQVMPQFPTISFLYGSIYASAQDTAQAFNELREAIKLKPNYEEAYVKIMEIYRDNGMPKQALTYGKTALKHCDAEEPLCFEIANNLVAIEQFDSAAHWYEKTLAQDPNMWQANFRMAKHLISQKRHKDAVKYYAKALEYNPNIEGGYYQLGYIYEFYTKELDLAVTYYKKAVRLNRGNKEIAQALKRAKRRLENPYTPIYTPVDTTTAG